MSGRLSRQIVLSMSLVSAITTIIGFVGSFIAYALLFRFLPPPPGPPETFLPQGPDYLIVAMFLMLGLIAAVVIALRLTRRILTPLNSLAESARSIAAGDLAVRANPGDRSLGETAHLVDDFNVMAAKLQDMAASMASWNAAIAHELRTPLTILRGRLQGVKDGVFPPSEELIHGLLAQVEGLSRLVDDLRIVTLQDSGHLEMRIEPVHVGAEVQRTVDSMSPALFEAGLAVEVTQSDIVLRCDGARLRQALMALLDNARRYAQPGKLKVELEATASHVVLRVEDEGPGLAPEFARQAFDPFMRDEPSRLRQYGGSGLGLAVVRAIVLAHSGEVQYRRSPVGGSIFEMKLPYAVGKPAQFRAFKVPP
ncbi:MULTISPECIES: ATP-binding protein [unclassified Variovorax]|uniref:ATP-binding protein n=1 Tax=unclassified Variovorax TaxID=663243 RepID=UPI003F475027